jgi:hypothetical protein
MALTLLIFNPPGPLTEVLNALIESQGMAISVTNRTTESLQVVGIMLGLGWENLSGVGLIVLTKTEAFHPVQAMLLSDLKCNVIKLSVELTVPGPTLPLQLPMSPAKVSFPLKILNTSLSFSVQKLVKFNVIDLAPGIDRVNVLFSL